MNPLHLLQRLRRTSADEVFTRGAQELDKRLDVLLSRAGRNRFSSAGHDLAARGPFFVEAREISEIVAILRRRMPDQVERELSRAGRVLDGRFDLLGYTGLDFGRKINWRLDPVSGAQSPAVPWPSVPFLDYAQVGDHKVVWELNRHQFLVDLAKAYRFTGAERYAAALRDLWYGWQRENPYPIGINWASSLEVALRALSWMWVAFLLEGTPASSPAFQQDLARETGRAAWHVARYLSTYFSPNTHLLGEAVALFLIGSRYPGLRDAARWRETGWRILLAESQRQVRPDGLYFEQSMYYHVYATDFLLHARIMAARSGAEIPAQLDETLRAMISAIAGLSQAGALPRFGDDDGGRLFDGARNLPEHMLDPLSTGAVLFRDARLGSAAPQLTEETLWLCGPEAEAVFDALPRADRGLHPAAFRSAGIYASTGRHGAAPAQLFIDAGELGPFRAGHGHADALSIQVACAGRCWLIDPGTWAYVGSRGERDRMRGTPAHNTLTVDGLSQADPRGPFAWGALPRVEATRWISGERLDFFSGRHSGYERLDSPVSHRRSVVGLREGLWLVRDIVETAGAHDLDIYWHFAPGLNVALDGATVVARDGERTLAIVAARNEDWEPFLESGSYSPAYGVCIPAPAVRWSARPAAGAELAVIVAFGEDAAAGALLRRDGPDIDGAIVYEFSAGAARHAFYFPIRPGNWTAGEWSSDAELLYERSGADGRLVILANGTCLSRGDRALLRSAGPVEYWEHAE